MIKWRISKGAYYDSVTLMRVAKEINKMKDIEDSSVVMGTNENLSILKNAGLFINEMESISDSDLLSVVQAKDSNAAETALDAVSGLLKNIRNKKSKSENYVSKSFESAYNLLPDANLLLISIAGKYAAAEAQKAIDNNINVMIFSDNVSIEDELLLKKNALAKNLLLMGPDCGTAIINGVPLAFANVVSRGNIGLVGASGTGLQEVTTLISKNGGGVSHAIGTGGRDVKEQIGGIMFHSAIRALAKDENTDVICLVSKPPHVSVLKKIAAEIKLISKAVVAIFIGADNDLVSETGAILASSLEEAALFSVALANKTPLEAVKLKLSEREMKLREIAHNLSNKTKGKYVRGLFSGGTLCNEAQLIFQKNSLSVYSNTPLHNDYKLENVWISKGNSLLDMGDDEFTSGRPHPMIDFSLRNKRIVEEAKDSEVAVILLDVVLGFGSNLNPDEELIPAIKTAKEISADLQFICSICGTEQDPQNFNKVKNGLESTGVIVMPSNVAASQLCVNLIQNIK